MSTHAPTAPIAGLRHRSPVWDKIDKQVGIMEEIMNAQRASFLLLVALLVSLAAMPVGGQTTTTGSSAAAPVTQGTAPIPDLSGIWAHLSWPGVERPTAGPGPVTNRSRREGVSVPAGRRFYQSDTQPGGSGDREAARRNFVARNSVPYSKQPMLAWRGAVRFLESRDADDPAAGEDHHPLGDRPARRAIQCWGARHTWPQTFW